MNILEAKGLTKKFGGLVAVDRLNFSLRKGQILGLIGPNGAGKSTAFNCIAGVYPPNEGEIFFDGEKINNQKPWNLAMKGLARTFQFTKPFATKTVLYNVMVGAFATTNQRTIAEKKAIGVLDYFNLVDKRNRRAGALTIADSKRLEIAKALATEPKLLLLDEVMAGLRPTEVDEMVAIIRKLRDQGITIFIIEHIMRAIMSMSDFIIVIHFGKKIAEGIPEEITKNKAVIDCYLGGEVNFA